MKLMTLNQYRKMSKTALIRKITKALRDMPKAKLAHICYNITKYRLSRLKFVEKRIKYGEPTTVRRPRLTVKRKRKRKFSRKQLAAQRLFAKRARAGTLRKRRRR